MVKKLLLLSVLVSVFMLWAAPAFVAEKPVYKIGVNLELTGPWAELTKTVKNTMVMEVERIMPRAGWTADALN
jgi:hypothetical protein